METGALFAILLSPPTLTNAHIYIVPRSVYVLYLLPLFETQTNTQITQIAVPVDGADAGDAVVVTNSLGQEPVPDLPGKHGGVLAFVIGDLVDHFGCSNLWFGAPDYPGADTARFIVPAVLNTKKRCLHRSEWETGEAEWKTR